MSLRVQRLPYLADSAARYGCVRHLPWPVFLDSGRPRVAQGRWDIIAAAPFATLLTRGGSTEIRASDRVVTSAADPFGLLRQWLAIKPQPPEPQLPFSGGAIGYFGYDLARRIEHLPTLAPVDDPLPEMAVGLYDWALLVDHEARCSWLVAQGRDPATAAIWDDLVQCFSHPPPAQAQPFHLRTPLRSNLSRADYQQRFERIQAYILEGDCYQVNFAQCFQAEIEGDAWSVYQRLRQINPAPFSALLESPYGAVLSTSPERFLQLRGERVQTCPIKGTAPRDADPALDRRLRQQLAVSAKDRAENLMIVDLLRNDLGRVCQIGSIEVGRLFGIESFARVHHLVSTIEGKLAAGEDALSLLRACFPGGSITGAPKLRAMQIIEELEGQRRGVYCGAIGYIGFDGGMDTNIAIRTLVMHDNRLCFWAGGGIVSDSEAEAEYRESLAKAAAMFELFNALVG